MIYKNILVVRTDRIGDVVLTTPALKALRQAFPQSKISLLVSSVTQDLVKANPNIDEVLVDDRQGIHKGFLGFCKLVLDIRKKNYDLAIIYHTKKRINLLCFFSGIPHRLGYGKKKYGFLLTQSIVDERAQGLKHEAEYCLDLLKDLGVKKPSVLQSFVSIQPKALEWAKNFFKDNRIDLGLKKIVIHPGASCPTKKWPTERFVSLIEMINNKYSCVFILIGTPDLMETAEEILKLGKGTVYNCVSKTSLSQVVALLKECDLLISNDSGPVHVADAVGLPVISIFTRNQPGINPERWGPLGAQSCIISASPYEDPMFAKSEVSDPKLLELIEPDEVLEAVDAVFKLC